MPPELMVSYQITHPLTKDDVTQLPFSYLDEIGTFMVEMDEYFASLAEMLKSLLRDLRLSMVSALTTDNLQLLDQLWEEEDWVFFLPADEQFELATIKLATPLLTDLQHQMAIETYIEQALKLKLDESPIEMKLVFEYIGQYAG